MKLKEVDTCGNSRRYFKMDEENKKGREKMKATSCEECAYFEYDEEEESYGCQFYFDEDDIARASLYGDRYICPHFQYKDEYRIVRKQI